MRAFLVTIIGLVFAILLGIILYFSFVSRINAGYVGVKVNLIGNEKGVQIQELGVGRHWIGINENLYKFPTFVQNVTWTNSERISFQTKDGMKVSADVGLTYSIDPTKATVLFQKYRAGINEITNVYLKNIIKDAFNEMASGVSIEQAYGEGRVQILRNVEKRVSEQVEGIGIIIDRVYYTSDLILPQQVTDSINAKVQANQIAILRENEVQESEAIANKLRAEAKGKADAKRTLADADAYAMDKKGESIRKNRDIIYLDAINRWDGVLPRVFGGGADMILDLENINK